MKSKNKVDAKVFFEFDTAVKEIVKASCWKIFQPSNIPRKAEENILANKNASPVDKNIQANKNIPANESIVETVTDENILKTNKNENQHPALKRILHMLAKLILFIIPFFLQNKRMRKGMKPPKWR